jgi:hypothetical protein
MTSSLRPGNIPGSNEKTRLIHLALEALIQREAAPRTPFICSNSKRRADADRSVPLAYPETAAGQSALPTASPRGSRDPTGCRRLVPRTVRDWQTPAFRQSPQALKWRFTVCGITGILSATANSFPIISSTPESCFPASLKAYLAFCKSPDRPHFEQPAVHLPGRKISYRSTSPPTIDRSDSNAYRPSPN